ncbi:hypothetical protein DB44_HJ00020 [Candidatus Protochlamydia amoebophila]|uniref:Uncharacterized protein n=1 Tax=Candidatus Protochlamydia amoebophila TaxID=362787 RepID=A0A0C1JJ97_9BACT|nr:hypothetical protein DB44_HJ00020 [Candidatus Protochlamydia amoebophila]
MLLLSTWYVHHLHIPNHYSPHTSQKTLEGHAAPKATTLQKYSTTFRALFDAPGVMEYVISTLPLHLCCQSWLTVPLFQSYQGTQSPCSRGSGVHLPGQPQLWCLQGIECQ